MSDIVICDGCGKEWDEERFIDDREPGPGEGRYVSAIPNLWKRLAPGAVVPYGDCPECKCLCYVAEATESISGDPKILRFPVRGTQV